MKTVILCEGPDDKWFIAYYINSKIGWNVDTECKQWKNIKIRANKKQEVVYMHNLEDEHSVAICCVGGQDRFQNKVDELYKMNEEHPEDPINSIIIFRDRDDRDPEVVVQDMKVWFDNVELKNKKISIIDYVVDEEYDIQLRVLPIIIPLNEAGAVETLILEAIEDEKPDGKCIAEGARQYVDDFLLKNLKIYLQHKRDITKAKLSAAIAIRNPDHSTKLFKGIMESVIWEKSEQVEEVFAPIIKELLR